jgi:hypothetical protein
VVTHLADLWPQIEFLHTSVGDATRGGTKDVAYTVYYRSSHDGKWDLAGQFRAPEHAVALIFEMIAAAIRRRFDLSTLEFIKIDLQIPPRRKAPEVLMEVESGDPPDPQADNNDITVRIAP